jgi:cytosine/creatinine deaminase
MGVDVVGGIPHFERTMADGAASVTALCEIAAERGLRVDMHCDETDDPPVAPHRDAGRRDPPPRAAGRVAGSHLTSMHSMDNYYVSKLLPLMAEAGRRGDRQSADQHRHPGPPRHLSRSAAA